MDSSDLEHFVFSLKTTIPGLHNYFGLFHQSIEAIGSTSQSGNFEGEVSWHSFTNDFLEAAGLF